MKRYRMNLKILSPVHIGSGQELDPLEYFVKDRFFYRLNMTSFLQDLPDRLKQNFYQAVNAANPINLRRFIADNIDLDKYTLFLADASESFVQAYERNLNNPRNQLLVNLMTRTGASHYPYLPGSSIKGAIRTAVISCLAKQKNTRLANERSFENQVLGHADGKQDPFRCVKISDAVLPDNATFIDKVEIFKPDARSGPSPVGIQMFYEQCFSMLDNQDITAATQMAVDNELPDKNYFNKRNNRNENAVSMKLSAEQIVKCCREFYTPKMQSDHNLFYKSSAELDNCNSPLLDMKFGDNEFPIRMGRFSHIECTTVDGLRKPGGAAARRGFGTTRTLSGGDMAMGWVKVSLKPME